MGDQVSEGSIVDEVPLHDSVTIIIFGATGDLTRRKLIPALYIAHVRDLLPQCFEIVGFARRDYNTQTFQSMMIDAVKEYSRVEVEEEVVQEFAQHISYFKGDITDQKAYSELKTKIEDYKRFPANRLFYLSIIPSLFEGAVHSLKASGLAYETSNAHWSRVVIEKPFGKDLQSARALNTELLRSLDESQIYRIDHYLGKETVQNILSFRFANTMFEPIFNRAHVDHIQITAAETVGMESGRGGYYDEYGAIRDMVTNHLLELLCLVTMEPPGSLSADVVRNEKVKVLNALQLDIRKDISDAVVRGQYVAGPGRDSEMCKGYLEEDRIDSSSETETFAAMRFRINNWRWAGVPIFLRTGKRLARKTTEIAIQFKVPPLQLFRQVKCEEDVCDITHVSPNMLIFQIQPDEGIFLKMATKRPGLQFVVEDVQMDFSYSGRWKKALPDAYERLLMASVDGDSTLFTRSDEVEAEWRVVDPIVQQLNKLKPRLYRPNSWGPSEANDLFAGMGSKWRNE